MTPTSYNINEPFNQLIAIIVNMASVSDNLLLKEKEHVHDVYSKIASHFSDTRYKAWPRIAEFLNSLPSGSSVADIGGCGLELIK